MTGYKKIFDLKRTKIKMSLELFHEVLAGAIETLFDEQNHLLFTRADLGKCLGIRNIGDNFKDFPSHYARPRSEVEAGGLTAPLGRTKNPHDIFINLDGSIEMAVRSRKTKGNCFSKMADQEQCRKNTRRTSTSHHRP